MRVLWLLVCFCLSWPVHAEDKTLLILGDSISAGYGIDLEQGWVSLLQSRLNQQGYRYKVINASITGDTSQGALRRLDKLLSLHNPDISLIELGGNDGLRGLSLEEMSNNLTAIIQALKNTESKILIVPMKLPPNYGPAYNQRFESIYTELSQTHGVDLGVFILEGVADKPGLMQDDGIHPLAAAQQKMLDNIWPQLAGLLERL